jgi:hypothetical protein
MKIGFTSRLLAIAAVMALAATLTGCKDDGPASQVYVNQGNARPMRIAILEFNNLAPRSDEAGRVVTNAVVTYMLSTGAFDVVEPGVVDQVMREQRILPPASGMDAKSAGQLREALNVDAILTGSVQEYGEVRIGNETYPSVSFSVRLVSAKDASIIWAGTVSRTGADKVLLFDIKRISSMGKLVNSAVASMASSMKHDQGKILAGLHASGIQTVAATASGATPTPAAATQPATAVSTPPAAATTPAAATATAGAAGAAKNENKTFSEDELKALLPNVAGYTKKDVDHSKHYHDIVTAKYQIGDGSQFVEVKLVDYLKMAQTQKFLQTEHPGETVADFNGSPGFVSTSTFNYLHIDVAMGRFGLFVSGPAAKKTDVEKVTSSIMQALL